MVLDRRHPAQHNEMLGQRIRHPKSTNWDDDRRQRPAKRLKTVDGDENQPSQHNFPPKSAAPTPKGPIREVPDSDAEPEEEDFQDASADRQTDLESALPPVRTDKEAIQEYEAHRAAEEAETEGSGLHERLEQRKWTKGKSSIYVDAFNLALSTVLEEEIHLFDEAEQAVFEQWRELSYEAQYLYVRLFLRKTSAWHRVRQLGYYGDVADLDAAIEQLQMVRSLPFASSKGEITPGEFEPPEGATLESSFTFADSSEEYITTLEEASSLLKLDELKTLAKTAKVQGKNKTELLKALRRTSGKQSGLGWGSLKRSDTEESGKSIDPSLDCEEQENVLGEQDHSCGNRDLHFIRKIMEETGPCIRLTLAPLKLFERVHLVFYRSSEWTEKSLTTVILARIARRNFPQYIVSRSANIFPSRAALLEFEASLRTQFRIDSILEFNGTPTMEGLQKVLDVFEEIYPRWKVLLKQEEQKEDSSFESGERAYLRRLSPAWVYARIMHKGAYVMGKLKQHKREHEVLTKLLTQRMFHAARRGAWYQRKALLEEHYMAAIEPTHGRSDEAQKKYWKHVALRTCEDGLQDHLVHLIYHHDLQKRIMKLEKALKIVKREQHDFGHVRLAKPIERTVYGIQIMKDQDQSSRRTSESTSSARPSTTRRASDQSDRRRSTKTIWLDEREDHGECSVEAMCLSHYRSLGWKGYHSEGGIIRTLFAYLFYDVLFTYIPNVFQTPYQTCPLDLHSDSFYPSRLSEINARLAEIENGKAEEIVRRVWMENWERKTCVVGLDWGFELEDLCAIVRAFGGRELGIVCTVLAQEYAARGGGVPDLFLWREGDVQGDEDASENSGMNEQAKEPGRPNEARSKGEVMFAEVKSENDRLSDTQRMWIHVLTGAGIKVELCNAVAREVRVVSE